MSDVKPWEPVTGWFIAAGHDASTYESNRSWPFSQGHYESIIRSETVNNEGACRVTLANGQKIIVRAKK